jgi:hypothetical protein
VFFLNAAVLKNTENNDTTYLCDPFPNTIEALCYRRLITLTGDSNC